MSLLIARHGQTDWNLEQRWQSVSDIPLNAEGQNQAVRLAALLKARGCTPQRLISSPLLRAQKTAQVLGAAVGCDVETDPTLIELDLGQYEGRLEAELRAKDPAGYDAWRESCFLLAAPGGETIHDVASRIADLVANLSDREGDMLIVGHQGVNMAIKATLSNCFSQECLTSFRQSNDEIEVWQLDPAKRIGRIKADND